jgi:Ca-activated chloride channel family protein
MLRRLLLSLALATTPAALPAQGWIEIERPTRPGPLPANVVRVSSEVRVRIEGRVASVEVEEQFRNSGGFIAEGSYLYPMPGEAVFQNFSLWMGEQEIRGEMMNAQQAQAIYEEIVRRVRDPALLTLAGHGLIRARVFPIQPGETRRVVLRYTQLLNREGDALRVRYALGRREAGSSERVQFRLTAPGAGDWGTPYSPTHRITSRTSGEDLIVTLDSAAAGSGDVELFMPARRGLVGTTLTTFAPGGEDGYFMLLISPAQAAAAEALPRDLTFVVDVSGSMSGAKIEQARAALRQALGTLRAADRFRLISFSSGVVNFRDGFVAATRENLDAARAFVNGLVADGGTNIAGALDAALGQGTPEERLPIVVFMTDGVPSVGEQAPERIATTAGARLGRTRLFTFGIGQDVNTYLLDRLAQEGRGTAQYVPPEADVEQAVGSLLGKIQHPALTNLRIADQPVEIVQTYPSRLPDVFFGEELVIFGRYHGTGSGDVVVTGQRNGRTERFAVRAEFPANQTANAFIPRLWASRRIGEITRQIRLEGASEALVREVRELGLRHGIITEYTSYLVQEPGMVAMNRPADALRGQAAAPAPATQSGAGAFGAARASARMMEGASLAEADAAAVGRLEELASGGRGGRARAELRRVGGRLFVKRADVWTDASHQDSLRVVEVAPFSDAYFQLVRALPELGQYLGLAGESGDVLIAGRRTSIKITAGGQSTWRSGHLDAVVRAYRGA